MDEKVLFALLKNAVTETLKPMQTNLDKIDAQLAETEAQSDVAAAKQILANLSGFVAVLLEQMEMADAEAAELLLTHLDAANARLCALAEDVEAPAGQPEPPENLDQ